MTFWVSAYVVNLKGRICISEVYQQSGMSYIPWTTSSKSWTDKRRGEETLSQWMRWGRKRRESGGKKLKKNEGLLNKKLISREFLVVKEAYPSPSFVYYIHPKKKQFKLQHTIHTYIHKLRYSHPRPTHVWFQFQSTVCSTGQIYLQMTWLIQYLPTLCFF